MDLLGKLLLAGDHQDSGRFYAGESEPVAADDCFQRLHDDVAKTGIQVESGENPMVHPSFDGIAGAAVRRCSQIHGRRPNCVLEPVAEGDVRHVLQHLSHHLVRIPGPSQDLLHRQVDVYR